MSQVPTAPTATRALAPAEPVGSDAVVSVRALLDELAASLRNGVDPSPLRAVEALVERVVALSDEQRRLVDEGTMWQRHAFAALPAATGAGARRHLGVILRSVECAVDVVASWPAGCQPDPEHLVVRHGRCDLAELTRACCDAFRALAREREHEFHVLVPQQVAAIVDVDKVQRVILNLLFNAFKVTPVGGVIELAVEHQPSFDEAVIRVSDSGAGVAPGSEQAIFDRHRRADRSGPITADWLGFHLGVSRDFMALHGGGLRLVPRRHGGGAEFVAHLPLSPPPGVALEHVAPVPDLTDRVARVASRELRIEERLGEVPPERDHRPLVLIVEDSRVMQRVVTHALSDRYNVASALDGGSGLHMAAELRPDLIVTDLELPELDGAAMVRAIREREALDGVPILVVSARRDAAETVRLLSDGVQDVMCKPFLVRELQARAHNLLDAKRARDVLGGLLGERESDLGRMAADVTRKQRRLEVALEDLRRAREVAEGASRVKSNFLRMMSHELKTPVTALILQQQILAREPVIAGGPSRVQRSFASISRSISRLLHIVDTVLEWARVESGRFEPSPRPLDLGDATRAAVDEVMAQADNRGIAIDVAEDPGMPELVSDERLIELIAINLLERAVNVTASGRIEVSVCHGRGAHRVRVVDGGPPMSDAERRDLFDALGATRDLQRSGGYGSGLGLHVVRDLAHALGGDVALSDVSPAGNAVELILPTTQQELG